VKCSADFPPQAIVSTELGIRFLLGHHDDWGLTSAALRAAEKPETLQIARYCGKATLWLLSEHR